jgi:hypothetical protein
LKLEFATDSMSGTAYIVVDGTSTELFTTTTEGVKENANVREKRAYVLDRSMLTACGNNNKKLQFFKS